MGRRDCFELRRHAVETIIERIEPQEKVCPHCGKAKCEIGCERSERYEYIPAKVIRHEIIGPKLACRCGDGTVTIAPLPSMLVERGSPGASLVAHLVLSKYEHHLSLYDLQGQLADLGVDFPRQDLCNWIEKAAWWLQPIVGHLKKELLAGDYLQVDETPVKVLDPEIKGRAAIGWLWVAGCPRGPVIFEFHPGRGKEYAQKLIGDFKGYLQRDGYGVYGSLARERSELVSCGCWSHARLLPQSSLGKAVRYALNEWEALKSFLRDGRIELDNNLTENAVRPSAIGKRRWLFIGHPAAGWRSAVIYSITVTCRRLGIDPAEYLRDVLVRLPGATNRQIPELTPAGWKAAQERAIKPDQTGCKS